MSGILHEDDITILGVRCLKCKEEFILIMKMGDREIIKEECPNCGGKIKHPSVVYSSI